MKVLRKQLQQQQGSTPSTAELYERNNNESMELRKLIDLQKQEMRRLRAQIVDLEAKISERPPSGNCLPPLQQVSM